MLLDYLKPSKELVVVKKRCTDFYYDAIRYNNPDYLVLNCPDLELEREHIANLVKDIIKLTKKQKVIYITNKDDVVYWLRLFTLEEIITPEEVEIYVPTYDDIDDRHNKSYGELKLSQYGGYETNFDYEDIIEKLVCKIMKKQLDL